MAVQCRMQVSSCGPSEALDTSDRKHASNRERCPDMLQNGGDRSKALSILLERSAAAWPICPQGS